MSSFEWMELWNLTNDIEHSRSLLVEARRRGDRARVRALGDEITQAEKSRVRVLAQISSNIGTIPEPASQTDGPSSHRATTSVAKALPEKAEDKPATGEIARPGSTPPPKPREGAGWRHASAPRAAGLLDTVTGQPPPNNAATTPEPAPPAKATEGAGPHLVFPKADSVDRDTIVWDRLTPRDIETAQNELGARRAKIIARYMQELKEIDAEQTQLETLKQAIDVFLQKLKRSPENAAA
jgi:hypothetical protein